MKCKYHLCEKESIGKSQYCSHKCKNKWTQTEWLKRRKQKFVQYKGGTCEKCGYDKHHAALEFHHIDPSTKVLEVAAMVRTYGLEKIQEEIDKCILICSNCHRILHHEERQAKKKST